MNLRAAKAIPDKKVEEWVLSLDLLSYLYDKNIKEKFIQSFKHWLKCSEFNKLENIHLYTNIKICNGTAHAFDTFHWRYRNKRFLFFKGEFMYHKACFKDSINWEYLDNTELTRGDAVIISVPFSDFGRQHETLPIILDTCDYFNIPVLLDFAHLPCTKNINVDLGHKCIDMLTFSLSKAFHGAENLRIGLRFEKEDKDDSIDILNSVNMINNLSLGIGLEYINKFNIDYNWKTYKDIYYQVCSYKNLEPTDCIIFGSGGEEYKEYNRGSYINRVCISDLIGKEINARICKMGT